MDFSSYDEQEVIIHDGTNFQIVEFEEFTNQFGNKSILITLKRQGFCQEIKYIKLARDMFFSITSPSRGNDG